MNRASQAAKAKVATEIRAWPWPIDPACYNRSPIAPEELNALHTLGWDLRRQQGCLREELAWASIGRLVRPLDDALKVFDVPDHRLYRRSGRDAVAVVLRACARTEVVFWAWTPEIWAEVIGSTGQAFIQDQPGWLDGTARPFIAAFAYLLTGFTEFHRLGRFRRLSVAYKVFGTTAVDATMNQILTVLDSWGYQSAKGPDKLRTTIVQVLLANRSPRLEDLSTEMLMALRDDPAIGRWGRSPLYGVHRAVAALGYADAPPRPAGS